MARETSHKGRSPCECNSPVSHSFHGPCPPARAPGPAVTPRAATFSFAGQGAVTLVGGKLLHQRWAAKPSSSVERQLHGLTSSKGFETATETATEAVISWPLPGEKRTRRETERIEIAGESISFRETQGLVLLCCHCRPEATSQAAVWGILAVNHAASSFRSQSQCAHIFAHTLASNLVLLQTPAHYTGSAPTMLPDPSKQTSTWGGFVWSGHCHLRSWWPANINQCYGYTDVHCVGYSLLPLLIWQHHFLSLQLLRHIYNTAFGI